MLIFRSLIAVLCFASGVVHAAETFAFSNPPGPHAVGFKIVQQYDRSRLYKTAIDRTTGEPAQGETPRPLQTLIWYPAARGGKPVIYREYLETIATEDEFGRGAADVKRMTDARIADDGGPRRELVQREAALPMHAVRDAAAEKGKFPLVVYAPGYNGTAIENADLCEYLASHGYVVMSTPSLGTHTRGISIDLEGLDTQAGDISYLIGYASTLPQVDAGKVAVTGFSWGGLANVFAAARDQRIKALVSLDGSLRGYPQLVDGGKDAAKFVTPGRVPVPLLFLGGRPRSIETAVRQKLGTSYSFMNEMKYSDVYIVSFMPMSHGHFTSYGLRMAEDNEFEEAPRADAELAHQWATRYVLNFLDAYLKSDGAGLAFINNKPAANQAPARMIFSDVRRKGTALPATIDGLVQRLASEGFDKAIPVYDEFARQTPPFKLESYEIYAWGARLDGLTRPVQSREIFRLGTHVYPEQSSMLDALGELQGKTGQVQEAIATYRKVLQMDPKSANALKYLKEHAQ